MPEVSSNSLYPEILAPLFAGRTWSEIVPALKDLPYAKLWTPELLKCLPPVPWHESLAGLYTGSPSEIARRGQEALLRQLAQQSNNPLANSDIPLIQPETTLLEELLYPKDIIAVTIAQPAKLSEATMLVESRSPENPLEEGIGKTVIAEGLTGLRRADSALAEALSIRVPQYLKPNDLLRIIYDFQDRKIPLPAVDQTGWQLLTGNMTYIGLKDGQLQVVPIKGNQYDWQWDIARSILRRMLEKYDRNDPDTRRLQVQLAELIKLPFGIIAPPALYPVSRVIAIERDYAGDQTTCEWSNAIDDPTKVRSALEEQLRANPTYHASGHWGVNKEEGNRRAEKILGGLDRPPKVLGTLRIRGPRSFPGVAIEAINNLDKTQESPS